MSRTKGITKPARMHDCLYDPTFTVSTEREHWKAVGRTNPAGFIRVPVQKNMFSEIPQRYPNQTFKLTKANPVPDFVSREWPGKQDQARDTVEMYKKQNYAPGVTVPPKEFEPVQAGGKDLHRYFHRPIIPYLNALKPTNVVFAKNAELDGIDVVVKMEAQPATKTVGVQTDYRESETQTDPYTPVYHILPGTEPEELLVSQLTYKNGGLPVGLAAVELIERARAKRAWEKTLPGVEDDAQAEKRRMMMEEQEAEEWAYREKQIEKIQKLQIDALKKGLAEREANHEKYDEAVMARRWARQKEEMEKVAKRLRHHHRIGLRQLEEKHSNPENELIKRNIVQDYDDPGSKVFVPLTRQGVFMDSMSDPNSTSSRFLSTYSGILQFEEDLPSFLFEPSLRQPALPGDMRGTKAARLRKYNKDLKDAYDVAASKKDKTATTSAGSLRLLQKVEKPKIRPPTPEVEPLDDEAIDLELSVIHTQALIRGRGAQAMMAYELQDARPYIDEVKHTTALQDDSEPLVEARRNANHDAQRAAEKQKADLADATMAVDHNVLSDVGSGLDFLNKELKRLREERRIHALVLLADRQRRMNEAAEAGVRQREAFAQKRDDEIFRQLMNVQKASVDEYLTEFVVRPSIRENAKEEADKEVQEMITAVNNFNSSFEERTSKLDALQLAARLVHTFLIPEPEKAERRRRVRQDQESFLKCAHAAIYDTGKDLVTGAVNETRAASGERQQPSRGQSRRSAAGD
eukprot:scpid30785/ scgid5015/ AMY-1-associating protein expressed in testis 1